MATRSAILNLPSGQMNYVHFDGHPETRMAVLEHYNDEDKVNALFARCANTDVSELASTLAESVFYDQRGEDGCQWGKIDLTSIDEVLAILRESDCQYLYAWDGVRWEWTKVY